jgi:UDP-N-acetylglucosamine--N-acetylmuramyl-(pentapeptide) pyrophosphoryl-undecaprenol N-acetylglucosamine transferase
MRIVVSGGGTAGHISPILATVDALTSLDSTAEILYIGQANSMEAKFAAASGIAFAAIPAGKFRRLHGTGALHQIFDVSTLGLNARDSLRVAHGIVSSLKILRHWKPNVIFIKGGFVGLPVGLAAHLLHLPYVIHESDITPGLTNRILARWATKIAVGFPVKSYPDLPKDRLVYTGSPVRNELSKHHRLEGLAAFKLTPDLPVLLVTGGSQGAQAINDCLIEALPQLVEFTQVLHLTGEQDFERMRFELKRLGKIKHLERYQAHAFLLQTMSDALAAADVVVARAGANSISELAALGKPTILIPNYLHAGHQEANAKVLSRAGAAVVLDERRLTPDGLISAVRNLFGSELEQARLSKAITTFAKPDAALDLAQLILSASRPTREGE